jgi:Fe2+ or Zn2+ uptake regulation protein
METKIRNLEAISVVTANVDTVGFCIYEIDCISGDERGDFHICRDLDGTETLASIIKEIMEKCDNDGGVELAGHITTVHGICLEFHCDAAELRNMMLSPDEKASLY